VEQRSSDQAELEAFEARVGALAVPLPLALDYEIVGLRPAGRIDAEHPLVRTILGVRHQLGLPDRCGSGSTDANAAAALGIPAVSLGCARGSGMHTLHERIDLGSLELGVQQLGAVVGALGR